jgi:hypothetical protein
VIVLYAVIALAVAFAVAAFVVGREARRLDAEPPRATFDLDEATEWVANHLPFDVSAVLTYDDVRRILEWNLDVLRARGLSSEGDPATDGAIVVDRDELVAALLERSATSGGSYDAEQVQAVLDAQFSYFDAIGAIGPEAGPDEHPD